MTTASGILSTHLGWPSIYSERSNGRTTIRLCLLRARRLDDARAYAEAALANFRTFGDRASFHIQAAEDLPATIDQPNP